VQWHSPIECKPSSESSYRGQWQASYRGCQRDPAGNLAGACQLPSHTGPWATSVAGCPLSTTSNSICKASVGLPRICRPLHWTDIEASVASTCKLSNFRRRRSGIALAKCLRRTASCDITVLTPSVARTLDQLSAEQST